MCRLLKWHLLLLLGMLVQGFRDYLGSRLEKVGPPFRYYVNTWVGHNGLTPSGGADFPGLLKCSLVTCLTSNITTLIIHIVCDHLHTLMLGELFSVILFYL